MSTVTFQGNPMRLAGELPDVGAHCPDFALAGNDLALRSLKDYAGAVLVLVCVPSLDTPVCDMEARRFNSEAAALGENVRIVVVSRDLPFAQARWCGAAGAKHVETLSDYRDGSFGKNWGVFIEELALLARAVFVIGVDGSLAYRELVPEVTQEPDYAAALEAVKKLV